MWRMISAELAHARRETMRRGPVGCLRQCARTSVSPTRTVIAGGRWRYRSGNDGRGPAIMGQRDACRAFGAGAEKPPAMGDRRSRRSCLGHVRVLAGSGDLAEDEEGTVGFDFDRHRRLRGCNRWRKRAEMSGGKSGAGVLAALRRPARRSGAW